MHERETRVNNNFYSRENGHAWFKKCKLLKSKEIFYRFKTTNVRHFSGMGNIAVQWSMDIGQSIAESRSTEMFRMKNHFSAYFIMPRWPLGKNSWFLFLYSERILCNIYQCLQHISKVNIRMYPTFIHALFDYNSNFYMRFQKWKWKENSRIYLTLIHFFCTQTNIGIFKV